MPTPTATAAVVDTAPKTTENYRHDDKALPQPNYQQRCMYNVIMLALGSVFLLIAMFTNSAVQELVVSGLNETNHEGGFRGGEGYYALALVTTGNGLVQLFSTPLITGNIIARLSPRLVMSFCSFIYSALLIAMLFPLVYTVLPLAFVSGVALGLAFTAQFTIISQNSLNNTRLMQRNCVLYWVISETAIVWGSILVYFCFQNQTHIGDGPRHIIYGLLTGCTVIAGTILLLMKTPPPPSVTLVYNNDDGGGGSVLQLTEKTTTTVQESMVGLKHSLLQPFRLLTERRLHLLFFPIIFGGLELTFMTVISPTAVGFTQQFGANAKSLSGLASIVCGIGEEILCVLMVYFMSSRRTAQSKWFQRRYLVLVASVFFSIGYLIILCNIPWNATRGETELGSFNSLPAAKKVPSAALVLVAAACLGAADAIYQTQMVAMLGDAFGARNAPAVFAITHFMQAVMSAASLFYTRIFSLQWHILILGCVLSVAVVTYWLADKASIRWKIQATNSNNNLMTSSTTTVTKSI